MRIVIDNAAFSGDDIHFDDFKALGEVVYINEPTRAELYAAAAGCDAIIVNKVVIDREFLDACPTIKYVGVFATGYNVVDTALCRERGVTVCNVPGYSTDAVAQHVFALMLSIFGQIPRYAASVAAGDWTRSRTFCYFPWRTFELAGKTIGILGYGSIGRAVAKIAEAFGMNVAVSTRTPPKDCPYKLLPLEEMLAVSDVVTLHCPLNASTGGIINSRTIAMMKDGAVLINTARGGLVDEEALRAALESGKLSAAGLDVVAAEPMRADNPLLKAKNCLITPHIAWAPLETRLRLLKIAAENLRLFMEGKPQNVVN